jgi:uncharacterized protein (TIGR03437 family)
LTLKSSISRPKNARPRSCSTRQLCLPLLCLALIPLLLQRTARAEANAAHISPYFEQSGRAFSLRGSSAEAEISPARITMGSQARGESLSIRWVHSESPNLIGEGPTGGVSNYILGHNRAQWRTGVPHYSAVGAAGLYKGIDAVYHLGENRLEFDLRIAPHANPARAEFEVLPYERVVLTSSGDLLVGSQPQGARLVHPRAWQVIGGVERPVSCNFVIKGGNRVAFSTGKYNRNIPLVIDPVVEYMTYIGGAGYDGVQTVGADASGNVILAGVSSSANFPGVSLTISQPTFLFVTKLNPTLSKVLFTTVLGGSSGVPEYVNFASANSLDVDSAGNIYLAGYSAASNFPTTPGAWRQSGPGGIAVKLGPSGNIVYSTFIGSASWSATPSRVRVRDGIAYLAGPLNDPGFQGTPGVLQPTLSGPSDLFAGAINASGSGPLFLTALGGSRDEFSSDMTLDAGGDLVITGESSSPDLPLTPDAFPYSNTTGQAQAVLVRIDPTGTQLLTSTWLGTSLIGPIALCPDGSLAIASSEAQLPAGLIAAGPHLSPYFPNPGYDGYVAKLRVDPLAIVWTADVAIASPIKLLSDAAGNLYWSGGFTWVSGGSFSFRSGGGIVKLSADGSVVLYAGSIPGSLDFTLTPDGAAFIAGSTLAPDLPVTSGALQTQLPAKTPIPAAISPNQTGFAGKIDLSSFLGANYFVQTSYPNYPSMTWRLNEPPSASLNLPVAFNGAYENLTIASTAEIQGGFTPGPPPSLSVNVNPSAITSAGVYQESLTVASPSNPAASLTIPITLTVLPPVSFEVATNQVNFQTALGDATLPSTTVALTSHFDNESNLQVNVQTDADWITPYPWGDTLYCPASCQLQIIVIKFLPPGTYNADINLTITGVQNFLRTIHVTYVVDLAAKLQVSPASVALHVVAGQAAPSALLQVTSAEPGVGFDGGYSLPWLGVSRTASSTPGQIQISADPRFSPVGVWNSTIQISGDLNQSINVPIVVDVSSGKPLDITPSSIAYTFWRNGDTAIQNQTIAFTSPAPSNLQWSVDQAWISPSRGSLTTPAILSLAFDTSLPDGDYHSTMTVAAPSGAITIPIIWSLRTTPEPVASPQSLSFNWQVGDPPPAAQQIQVASSSTTADFFVANAPPMMVGSAASFVSVTPVTATTPATLTATVSPAGLVPGRYGAVIQLSSSVSSKTNYPFPSDPDTYTVPVTLHITPGPSSSPTALAAVLDAASFLTGNVSPGEILTIFGNQLGPVTPVSAKPTLYGFFPLALGGTSVLFDGVPSPMIYTSAGQIVLVAPFGIAGKSSTRITVQYQNKTSDPYTATVAAASPSIFTADSSGSGIAAALNIAPDGSASLNSAANPVPRGGIVTIFATGLGTTVPSLVDGATSGAPLPTLSSGVIVGLGYSPFGVNYSSDPRRPNATIVPLYAGPAPTLIAGMMQINFQIPDDAPVGIVPLVLATSSWSWQGVTIAIK